jgi:prevent-host-death family protein
VYAQVVATIGVRELRANLAAWVRRAADGERVILSVGGQPAAALGPLEPTGAGLTLEDLAAAGMVEPPRRRDRPPAPEAVDVPVDVRLDGIMGELRGG